MHLTVAGLLHRQEEAHGERHRHEIDERGADHEQDRGGDEERQKGLALALIEPGRHEHVDLRGDHREGDEDRAEQSELHLGEKEFLRRGVDQFDRRVGAGGEPVGKQQEIVDRLGEPQADEKGDEDREQRPDQPAAELDQMLDQRRLARLDVLMGHGLGSAFGLRARGVLGAVAFSAATSGATVLRFAARLRLTGGSTGSAEAISAAPVSLPLVAP